MTQPIAGPIRVAVLTQGYQGGGGVRTTARWLVDRLSGAGYAVTVFDLATASSDPYSRRLAAPPTWFRKSLVSTDSLERQVRHVGANAVEVEPFRYLPRPELSELLNQFDLVQVITGGPALALAAMGLRPPVVLQVASTVAWERSSRTVSRSPLGLWRRTMSVITSRLEHRALRGTTKILVLNRQMRNYVWSQTTVPVELLATGIDVDRFTPAAHGWNPRGYALSLCRLDDPRKGLDRLIQSYACALASRPDAPDLILAGRGPLPRILAGLIVDLGVADRVTVRLDVTDSELPDLYRGASVFLQTSYEEGLGLSVLEAMACGLPVVTTITAGTLETVTDGESGWLVEQGPDLIAAAARRMLSVWDHQGFRMACAARLRAVSTFSDDRVFARYVDIYGELLSK